MNLNELYRLTPLERHGDIKVVGDRVFIKDAGGTVDEYLIIRDDELWLIHSDREQKETLNAIKSKLGVQ